MFLAGKVIVVFFESEYDSSEVGIVFMNSMTKLNKDIHVSFSKIQS